ncbi:MAG: FAD-dependent oxidoreductase [Pyrinomonadaceae bacterium]
MKRSAEVIIIGGGVVGASVAYHLALRGCRDILILEREGLVGLGSTGKATGGVRAQFETDINIQLSLYSLDFFANWEVDCGYDPRGYAFLATNELHLEYLHTSGERQRRLGYDGVRMLKPAEIADHVPGLNLADVLGASFGPRDGFIDPRAVLNGFLDQARRLGCHCELDSHVQGIALDAGRVCGVKTSNSDFSSDHVVICTGAWARELASSAGVDLPVTPQRRQIVWARASQKVPSDLPMVIDMSDGFHFRPVTNSDHEVLLAYADPSQMEGFETTFDESFIGKVMPKARHRAPFLADLTVIREKCRAGLYENSPDRHAIIGHSGVDGLYLANGLSGHGVMHSPAVGRAVAEIILDGEASFLDVSQLSIRRFATGELLRETSFI